MSKIIVVGGGAAGLGAAWTALEQGHDVTLIDANPDLGGRCRSHEWQGEWIIRGAAAFIGAESEVVEMSKALGIYDEKDIVSSQEEMTFTVLHHKKQFSELGSFDVPSILRAPVIPLTEKAKLALALPKMVQAFVSANERDPTSVVAMDDVNACEYFRKYSPAFVDYVLEPVMNQYCGYGEDDYSMAWLGWLMASPRSWSASQWTFAGRGVGKLTQTLEARLSGNVRCNLQLGATARNIEIAGKRPTVTFDVKGRTQTIESDALVVAVPGSKVPALMPWLPKEYARFFGEVQYVPHHIMHMIIDKPNGDVPFSLLLPTCEGYGACSNVWFKPYGPDPNKTLFYGEVKGKFCRENGRESDQFFVDAIWQEACKALPVLTSAKRHQSHLQRNDIGLCSRRKGYTTSLKAFRQLPPIPGIRFAGDYLINSTVGQSMRSGIDAANAISAELAAERARAAALLV